MSKPSKIITAILVGITVGYIVGRRGLRCTHIDSNGDSWIYEDQCVACGEQV